MAGFRNVLVHGYDVSICGWCNDVLESHLGDLTAFIDAVRTRVTRTE